MRSLLCALAVAAVLASAGAAQAATFSNGFETDLSGWQVFGGVFDPVRVASGTHGITSSGGAYHAEAAIGGYPATNWGGYQSAFPAGGYKTSIDIYLDVDGGWANDNRFDFTSAINNTSGSHRRDFAFNGGFYNDEGLGNRFVFTASTTTGRSNAWPKNPGRDPVSITQTGWYTFEHTFRDSGSGVLAVDLKILDQDKSALGSWTISDMSDLIGSTVGGNRYGWFTSNEFSVLAFDNASLTPVPEPVTMSLLCLGGAFLLKRRRQA